MFNFLDPLIDTPQDVLKMRARAMELYRQGVKLMEWTGEGTEAKKEWVAPVSEILRETRYYLKTYNPKKYGKIVRQSRVIRLM